MNKNKFKNFKNYCYKNKKVIISSACAIILILIVAISILLKKYNYDVSHDNNSEPISIPNQNLIYEKEMNFEELTSFQQEMKSLYGENYTQIYKFTNKELYFQHQSEENPKKAYALLVLGKNFNVSNKIFLPYLIFIPDLTSETLINGNKYYDINLQELKEYSKNNNKKIYIIKIKDLEQETNDIAKQVEPPL